jgi:hypothetical protein
MPSAAASAYLRAALTTRMPAKQSPGCSLNR